MKKLFLAFLILLAGTSLFAASNNVLVLFNGATEVNREAIKFMQREFSWNNAGYNLKYTQNPGSINPQDYKGIIVLNTGRNDRAVDPTLAAFVNQHKGQAGLVLVTLVSYGQKVFVDQIPAKTAAQGVDTITSASLWGSYEARDMHSQWVKAVMNLIGKV